MYINFKVIGSIILLFSFLQPEYFSSNPIVHMGFNVLRVIAIITGIVIMLKLRQVFYITFIITIFYLTVGVSTIINGGDLAELLSNSILIIGFVMWVELLLRNYPIRALQVLNFIFASLTYINLLFFLVFPNGYNNYYSSTGLLVVRYFLGVYNQFAAVLIPAVIISVIYSLIKHKKICLSTWVLISSVVFTFLYFWSATSILGIGLIIFYLIFVHKGLLKYFVNYKILSICFIALFIMIVFANNLSIFAFIIEDILNKDLTLSTRTRIWEAAIQMISQSPFMGYGFLEGGRYIFISHSIERNAHNMFLQILLQGGVIGLSTVILIITIVFRRISTFRNEKVVRFFLFSMFISFVMMLSEVYSMTFLLVVLLIGVYLPNILKAGDIATKKV